jgi:hypothetical protein
MAFIAKARNLGEPRAPLRQDGWGKGMLRRWIALACCGFVFMAEAVFAQATLPNLHIELSYRQLEGGKLSKGLHVFNLWCDNGRCDLTVLSLNHCLGGRFAPKVELASNMTLAGQREGTLQVHYSGDGLLQLEKAIDQGKRSYFLRFRTAQTGEEQQQTHNRLFPRGGEPSIGLVLTDFKGNLTKYSAILDKVISVEFVPLTEEYARVKLNCRALIPGTFSLKPGK